MSRTAQSHAVLRVISDRTSCRAYRPDAVDEDDIMGMLEAARLAPSACNKQPWRFAVVRDRGVRHRIVRHGFLPGITMDWALDAPVIIVIGMKTSIVTHRLGASVSGVKYPWVDIGIAGEHLVLAAAERGLGTCWIGWIKPRGIRKSVSWPRPVRPVAVITVGHPREGVSRPLPTTRREPLENLVTWI